MKRGVSIMFINGLVVAVVLLFSFGVDVTNRLVRQRYDQTVSSQRALIACNNASKVFQQQSDELTLHVNNYVETDSTDALLAIKEKIQEVNHRTVLVANMTMRISVSAGVRGCQVILAVDALVACTKAKFADLCRG